MRRRYAILLKVPAVLTAVPFVVAASPAEATVCQGNHHYYMGQATVTYTWEGVERYISLDNPTLYTGDQFQINFLGAVTTYGCNYGPLRGQCSIQAGYGQGNVGGYQSNNASQAYSEVEDYYKYIVNWPSSNGVNLILPQNTFVSVFFTGQTRSNPSLGDWAAYVVPSGKNAQPYLMGDGWMQDWTHALVAAQSEAFAYPNDAQCPGLPGYEYYGTDGAGNVNAGTQLNLSRDGLAWAPWPANDGQLVTTPPQYNSNSLSGWTAFKGLGG